MSEYAPGHLSKFLLVGHQENLMPRLAGSLGDHLKPERLQPQVDLGVMRGPG